MPDPWTTRQAAPRPAAGFFCPECVAKGGTSKANRGCGSNHSAARLSASQGAYRVNYRAPSMPRAALLRRPHRMCVRRSPFAYNGE